MLILYNTILLYTILYRKQGRAIIALYVLERIKYNKIQHKTIQVWTGVLQIQLQNILTANKSTVVLMVLLLIKYQ